MYDVVRVARVTRKILDKSLEEWGVELSKSGEVREFSSYEEVASLLVNLINSGKWKYTPYVKQELVITKPSEDLPISTSSVAEISYIPDRSDL